MDGPNRRAHSRARAMLVALALAGAAAVPACMRSGPGPQHGWWASRGPVIPHDSFPSDCTLCHTGDDWTTLRDDFTFDHEAETGVPLEGAHARAQCLRCHNDRGPVAMFAARGCAGCHEDVHLGKLGVNCVDCHVEVDWRPRGIIEQHGRTRFPLVGAHAATACWRCHPGAEVGIFVPTDVECITCHQDDLAVAKTPDHLAQGWTSECDRCHIPTTWTGAGFNHSAFPLTGKHRTLACDACHAGGIYQGLPHACVGCHQADYDSANDPDHAGLGFPTACERCHTTNGWKPADMDHSWIHDQCATCHLDDYLATTDPNHQAAGFPLQCEACHGTKTWFGANFDHDFPIDSGKHKALSCSDCHNVPNNFMVFTCTDCHAHNKADMDDKHKDERGYVWETSACYSCHPNGKADD